MTRMMAMMMIRKVMMVTMMMMTMGKGGRQKTSDRAWAERLALADLSLAFMIIVMIIVFL